ncbi:hypothetical protein CYMTET_5976 [Cymbomonas tetramitiformis]|uniref:Rab-GAP TBC domain-containing protein n=1 Tax=Cymbomonas tetramitiformis TaxID=36881 RepID=A0AAE0LIY5_9CHLO|nr:hypothetical protein CYMTET_5976 [Cymbomonas tetramitiformis]
MRDVEVLNKLVTERLPKLASILAANQIPAGQQAVRWFLCCFVNVLPVELVVRVWDALMFAGNELLFRVALLLLKQGQPGLVSADDDSAFLEQWASLGRTGETSKSQAPPDPSSKTSRPQLCPHFLPLASPRPSSLEMTPPTSQCASVCPVRCNAKVNGDTFFTHRPHRQSAPRRAHGKNMLVLPPRLRG